MPKELLPNPFINNTITMDIVEDFIYHLCQVLGRGPANENEGPNWGVYGEVSLEMSSRTTAQKIYCSASGDLHKNSSGNLSVVFGGALEKIPDTRCFFKAIEIHLDNIIKSLDFTKDKIYESPEISVNNCTHDNGYYGKLPAISISIKFKNPKYNPPVPPKKWF